MKTTFRTVLCVIAVVLAFAYCQKSNESEEGGQEPLNVAGALNGKFSVSPTKMVYFSKGNLQATINEKGVPTAWKFAANQYDFLGEGGANKTIGTQAGDVDLFCWSTPSTNYGISTYEEYYKNTGEFVDWGKAIGNGKTWRTLSVEEWDYLFNYRTTSTVAGTENARYAKATVCLRAGMILLPDIFVHPAGVPPLKEINPLGPYEQYIRVDFEVNNYNSYEWGKMESAGAVFLPAAGGRYGSHVYNVGYSGHYWSSSAYASDHHECYAYALEFGELKVDAIETYYRCEGNSVRLVIESK